MKMLAVKDTVLVAPIRERLMALSKTIPKGKWIMAKTIADEWGVNRWSITRTIKALKLEHAGIDQEVGQRVSGLKSWRDR